MRHYLARWLVIGPAAVFIRAVNEPSRGVTVPGEGNFTIQLRILLVIRFLSVSRCFQQGKGPSRGPLRTLCKLGEGLLPALVYINAAGANDGCCWQQSPATAPLLATLRLCSLSRIQTRAQPADLIRIQHLTNVWHRHIYHFDECFSFKL